MDKKSSEYKLIRMADTSFLFCIIFEVVGIMTVMFLGTLGAQMAIYFMTMFLQCSWQERDERNLLYL